MDSGRSRAGSLYPLSRGSVSADTPFPKPPKRPRTRTPLKRTRKPRRKRKGKKASLAREADRLWSLLVRARGPVTFGLCEYEKGFRGNAMICPAPLSTRFQAAHGISRRYRNTRWLLINGFCLCPAHHVYYTHRPLEWDEWLRIAWGEKVYNELRLLALRTTPPDVGAALAALQSEAKARGIL